ncbi:DUF2309 domain-containing protein [Ferrimicrobium sp.]|uniref:DUF2309 domain-containing protein n=1 Tax=Ferrimicrobium sp. TaxID=2926050 RepID=UPI002616E10F|nr:DUF2309 domain-containing protein [Ferrimicrobium sp.]
MSDRELRTARARLLVEVEEAARLIAPLWPLSTFIAVNPFWDLRQMSFAEAIAYAVRVLGISGYPSATLFAEAYRSGRITVADLRVALEAHPTAEDGKGSDVKILTATERYDFVYGTRIAATTEREVAKWSAAFLAKMLPVPPDSGFYAAWLAMIPSDPAIRRIVGRSGRDRLAQLSVQPEDAILSCLERLGIAEEDRVSELARQLARMPGWAGHAKWRSRWAPPGQPGPTLHLVDYLAVRLGYEAELFSAAVAGRGRMGRSASGYLRGQPHGVSRHPDVDRIEAGRVQIEDLPSDLGDELSGLSVIESTKVWLAAYEGHYRDQLLDALSRPASLSTEPPAVQAVFCIDVRSEGLRRHLEVVGSYETFGFAGFFALPIRHQPWGSAEEIDLCPVLLHPSSETAERPCGETDVAASRQLRGRQAQVGARMMFDTARKAAVSPYILAEAAGFLAGPMAAAKTLFPALYLKLRSRVRTMLAPPVATVIETHPRDGGMSDEEQALFAETALITMGLTRDFAPLVLLCGHGSTTENNPYASSLDCGACGGNRGGASARAAAWILNRATTRDLLAQRGISIPEETVFIAGEHDTATDRVIIFDLHLVPFTHRDGVAVLEADLERAAVALAKERARLLPGAKGHDPVAQVTTRSADWAQVQPEWGLARNGAFIVAPRSATIGADLECRCFLHSYDAAVDPDGVALETILTAPMVVGHWINAQYYFSTVDPDLLSAGDKTVHNIVAGTGVVAGAGGDLKVGLPLQSLFESDREYHEPMRLLTIVQAPQDLLVTVIDRNPVLRELFDGQWVHLAARDDQLDNWKIRRPDGTWARWSPAATYTEEVTTHG